MTRLAITRETLNALFAKSGNVCAFPGCTHELVTARNLFVGQICHIEAANPGGQRYCPNSTDEDRRSFKNLMLMCYRHHKETDDETLFTPDVLQAMKFDHESKHGQKPFKVNEAFLFRLESEMETYWSAIARANTEHHIAPQFAVPVKVSSPATEQFSEISRSVARLAEILSDLATHDAELNEKIRAHLESLGYNLGPYDALPYYRNPFIHRNWETHSLAVNNTLTDLVVALKQAEVRFLSEYLKTHWNESDAEALLNSAKKDLHEMAISAGYAD